MTKNEEQNSFLRNQLFDESTSLRRRVRSEVPTYASLLSLVCYLFLKVEDDGVRTEHIGILFSPENDPNTFLRRTDPRSFDDLLNALKDDATGYEFYENALNAMQNGEIEAYQDYYDQLPLSLNELLENQNVYTIGFLIWVEKQGYEIPELILEETKELLDYYVSHQQRQRAEKENFPELSGSEFANLASEPLWTFANAILYIFGHQSETSASTIQAFISRRKATKKIIDYAKDAASIGDLVLIGDFESDEDLLLKTKIKPREFISWIEGLPLSLPFLNLINESGSLTDHAISIDRANPKEVSDTKLTERERETLLKLVAAMAVKGYRFDPEAKRNDATSDILNDLDQLGISLDKKTVLKWLREACSRIDKVAR